MLSRGERKTGNLSSMIRASVVMSGGKVLKWVTVGDVSLLIKSYKFRWMEPREALISALDRVDQALMRRIYRLLRNGPKGFLPLF